MRKTIINSFIPAQEISLLMHAFTFLSVELKTCCGIRVNFIFLTVPSCYQLATVCCFKSWIAEINNIHIHINKNIHMNLLLHLIHIWIYKTNESCLHLKMFSLPCLLESPSQHSIYLIYLSSLCFFFFFSWIYFYYMF